MLFRSLKFRVVLDIFDEMGIFRVDEPTADCFRICAVPSRGKTDLEGSRLLRRLRERCTGENKTI